MQDGAPCRASRSTMEALFAFGINPIVWLPYNPDLNSIDSLKNTMKIFIQAYYPKIEEGKQISQRRLHHAVIKAWASITTKELS